MSRPRTKIFPKRFCQQCGKEMLPRQTFRKDNGLSRGWHQNQVFCSARCVGLNAHETQFQKRRGWHIDKAGYVILGRPGGKGYHQPQHRAVMEQMLGRKLTKHETVHHRNGVRTDNRPENLELWSGRHGRGQRANEQDIWSGMIPAYQFNAVG